MSQDAGEDRIRRILVAVDASPHSMAALRAAAELAEQADAELLGVYVEDINLLRLSELPVAQQVSIFSAGPRQLNYEQVKQQLRLQARQARQAMERIARRHHVRWSFRVVQGIIPLELLAAARESDLVLVGKAGWSRRRRIGSTTRMFIIQSPIQALIMPQGTHLGLPVGIVYDGSELGQKSLQAAMRLLRRREGYLVVLILAENVEKARELQDEAASQARPAGLHIHFRWLVEASTEKLAQLAGAERCGLLVMPGRSKILSPEALVRLVDEIQLPVLVMR